jgi:hypothetical protein
MNCPIFKILQQVFMAWKRSAWEPSNAFNPHPADGIEQLICKQITIPKVMMCRDCHPIPQSGLPQCCLKISLNLVTIGWIISACADTRFGF